MQRVLLCLTLSTALLMVALAAAPVAAQQPDDRCFAETGFCISGAIREYWEQNGGEQVFGYPISDVHEEQVEDWSGPVQWFERDRLEDHSADRVGVKGGLLGVQLLDLKGKTSSPVESAASGCRYFPETKHSLCEPFLSYWEGNGDLERFGYPITEPLTETVGVKSYLVQYFERRRMEDHLGEPGERVQLGKLGKEILDILDPPETPSASASITGPTASDETYTFEISIDSAKPETIRTVEAFIYDSQHHEAYRNTFEYQPGKSLSVAILKNQLTTSGEYSLEVRAKDTNDKDIRTQDGKIELATAKFGHTIEAGPQPPTATISVDTMEKDAEHELLPVRVAITDEDKQLEAQKNFINSTVRIFHSGVEIASFQVKGFDLENPVIKVPLELNTLQATQEYEVVVVLEAPGFAPIESPPHKFNPKVPAQPKFWERYIRPVISNPLVVAGILLVFFIVVLALMYMSRPRMRAIPVPWNEGTRLAEPPPNANRPLSALVGKPARGASAAAGSATVLEHEAHPSLRVSVVQPADPSQRRDEVITSFPCVIGREGADLLIPGDKKVSRRHAELAFNGETLVVKDLNSANGTAFVTQDPSGANGSYAVKMRLERGGSAEWDNHSLLRLGPNTVLKLEPQSAQQGHPDATQLEADLGNETRLGD